MFLVLLFALPLAAAGPRKRETAKRDGARVEQTITPGPAFKSDAERLERIQKMQRRDEELIARLKPPVMFCRRVADGSIKVDGKLDDAAWKQAGVADNFRDTRTLKAEVAPTRAMLLWDSKHLYVGFDCADSDVLATIAKRDGDFWKEDTAEVFIDADADGTSYLEFEVSPRGLLYDGAVADSRPETDWLDLTHLDINKSRDMYDVRDSKVAAHVDGTSNDSDKDQGWTCEMALSWSDIGRGTPILGGSPAAGDRWRIGLYRINVRSADDPKLAEYAAWSPTNTWFHNPKLFGHVIFVDKR